MVHEFDNQYRLLVAEYRACKDKPRNTTTPTMNGTFGDPLWLSQSADDSRWPENPMATNHQADAESPNTTRTLTSSIPTQIGTAIKCREIPPTTLSCNEQQWKFVTQTMVSPAPPQESARVRKGHKKSRAGCFNCKKRYATFMLA